MNLRRLTPDLKLLLLPICLVTLPFLSPSISKKSSKTFADIAIAKGTFCGGIFTELNHILMHVSGISMASQTVQQAQ